MFIDSDPHGDLHRYSAKRNLHHANFFCHSPRARQVALVGDFNNWNNRAHGLVRQGPGAEWELTVPLKPGRYRYKFLLNNTVWTTDGRADAFESDGFGGQCSVVVVK